MVLHTAAVADMSTYDSTNDARWGRGYLCDWPIRDEGSVPETCLQQLLLLLQICLVKIKNNFGANKWHTSRQLKVYYDFNIKPMFCYFMQFFQEGISSERDDFHS